MDDNEESPSTPLNDLEVESNFILTTNARIAQALIGHETASDDTIANTRSYYHNTGASIPRSYVSAEEFVELRGRCHSMHEGNIELPGQENEHVESPTLSRPLGSNKTALTTSGPSPEQWEARRAEIGKLYVEEGRSLSAVMKTMSSRGFHATLAISILYFLGTMR
jgi:hypothetical protein